MSDALLCAFYSLLPLHLWPVRFARFASENKYVATSESTAPNEFQTRLYKASCSFPLPSRTHRVLCTSASFMENKFAEQWERSASQHSDKQCLVATLIQSTPFQTGALQSFTYREVDTLARRGAALLHAAGFQSEHTISLCLPNVAEWAFWFLAVSVYIPKATINSLDPELIKCPEQLAYRLQQGRGRHVIVPQLIEPATGEAKEVIEAQCRIDPTCIHGGSGCMPFQPGSGFERTGRLEQANMVCYTR